MYQTEYCIWTNYMDIENTKEDLWAYQLNSLIFEKLNLNGGIFTQVTKALKNEDDYLDTLSLLAYDVLYGEQYCLDEKPLVRSNLQMGRKKIKIFDAEIREETVLIHGEGFTKYSDVIVDGERITDTVFIDWNTLKIDLEDLNPEGSIISVGQFNKQSNKLGESESFRVAPFVVTGEE